MQISKYFIQYMEAASTLCDLSSHIVYHKNVTQHDLLNITPALSQMLIILNTHAKSRSAGDTLLFHHPALLSVCSVL